MANCFLCLTDRAEAEHTGQHNVHGVHCPLCGRYEIDSQFAGALIGNNRVLFSDWCRI